MTTPAGSRPDPTPAHEASPGAGPDAAAPGVAPGSGAVAAPGVVPGSGSALDSDAAPGSGSAPSPRSAAGSGADAGVAPGSGAEGGSTVAAGSGGEAGPEGAGAGGVRRSGLKNPAAAVRGMGAGTLALEAIVLLLAIQPIRILAGDLSGWGIGAVVALAVAAVLLAGMMKRSWAWAAGTVLQVLLLATAVVHWSLGALGLIFGAAWVYALHVRRVIEAGVPAER